MNNTFGEVEFDPYLCLLMCSLLKNDIQMLNDRIDITTEPTYFFINDSYFYNIILALHANENVKIIKRANMPIDELVYVVKRDTYIAMHGEDIEE